MSSIPISIARILERRLLRGGVENHRQEARWLAESVLGRDPGLSPEEALAALDPLVRRRISGEPLQYVLGSAQFYDLELEVGPGVLIPRPETELLVDLALERYPGSGDVLDLCTGSGAVLLNLALHLPGARLFGTDISPLALHWAELNQRKHRLENVVLLPGDLFEPLPRDAGPFSLITANPPYVSEQEYDALDPVVKDYEPRSALLAFENGLQVIRRIVEDAGTHLLPGGWLVVETGCDQGEEGLALLRRCDFADASSVKDYAGRHRFIAGRKNS